MWKNVIKIFISVLLVFNIVFSANVIDVKAEGTDDVLACMNAVREEAGLPAYVLDDTLQVAAATRAQECSTKFSHVRPNGGAWYTVSDVTRGENLAHAENSNQSKAENVVLAWCLSPKHNANVMRSTFTSVGIAYYYADSGDAYIVCEFK